MADLTPDGIAEATGDALSFLAVAGDRSTLELLFQTSGHPPTPEGWARFLVDLLAGGLGAFNTALDVIGTLTGQTRQEAHEQVRAILLAAADMLTRPDDETDN